MVGNEVTGAVNEDGALVIKDKEGKEMFEEIITDLKNGEEIKIEG